MSFPLIGCSYCSFEARLIPTFFHIKEGKIFINMYPDGEREMKDPHHSFFALKPIVEELDIWSYTSFQCPNCQSTSERPTGHYKCEKCKNTELIDVKGLEGKPCPFCNNGYISKKEPKFKIHF